MHITNKSGRTGEFRSKNTLKSTERPNFCNAAPQHWKARTSIEYCGSFEAFTQSSNSEPPNFELPHLINSTSQPSKEEHRLSLSSIGNSSSLFDSSSPASSGYSQKESALANPAGSIHIVSRGSAGPYSKIQDTYAIPSKMVIERSSAKAPLSSIKPIEQAVMQNEEPNTSKPAVPYAAPRFGESTMPQSPLNRATLESKVLIMPKPSKPDFQRDQPKTSRFMSSLLRSSFSQT
jgi:hypothetical protein